MEEIKQNSREQTVENQENSLYEEFTLPSGKKAEILKMPSMGDIEKAEMMTETQPRRMMHALASVIVKIDGKHFPMEDFLKMDAVDGLTIVSEIQKKPFVEMLRSMS